MADAPSPHGLDSAHHTGTLDNSQIPQALLTDGTRTLAGNLAVSGGITIDGVDISVLKNNYDTHLGDPVAHNYVRNLLSDDDEAAPKGVTTNDVKIYGVNGTTVTKTVDGLAIDGGGGGGGGSSFSGIKDPAATGVAPDGSGWILTTDDNVVNVAASGANTLAFTVTQANISHGSIGGVSANQHHNQQHLFMNGSGLGPDHTVSGLTEGTFLRASSATTLAFGGIAHSELQAVTANQHHNQAHVLATNTALGADHTISGATAGHVLRASSATAAAFAQLALSDLSGAAIGTNLQAWDANLDQIAALAVTDSNIIVGNGSAWVAESGATARTSLGVGTGDSPQFTAVELGHATDTTIARVSAGLISVEGNTVTLNTATQTLTNKTLTAPVIATIVNTGTLTLPTSTDTMVGRATTDTLTNKTLTAPVIATIVNTGTLTLPTSTDTLVGRATTDTLTNKTISADSNTLSGIAASSFVLSNASGNIDGSAAQKAIPSGVVVGTTDTQTLSAKTLTAPQINDTSADHQYIVGVSELIADRTVTLPLLTGNDTFVFAAHTQSLTNKSFGNHVDMDDTLDVANDLTAGSVSSASITPTNLTASRLVASDGSKKLVSVATVSSWIAGTTNRVTISDDGDGTATLTGPQDIHTGASPTFARATLSQTTGTAPLTVSSTTKVANLNADLLDDLNTSSNPGAAAAVLASTAAGALTLVNLTATTDVVAPLVRATTGASLTLGAGTDVILNPTSLLTKTASGVSIQSSAYASQTTGWRATDAGEADFRYLFVDEMHAKSFIADLEQALAGGQIISKSVAMVATDFTLPTSGNTGTLRVRDLPSAPNMAVFQSGDFVGMRQFSRAAGSLTIGWAWGTVTSYADGTGGNEGTQTWTFTRSATPGAATGTISADSLVLDFGTTGNGFYEVNAIDGAYGANSPYAQVVTWASHPATQTVRARFGHLRGIFSVTDEHGLYAGSGTAVTDRYIRASSSTVELRNVPLALYDGSNNTMLLSAGASNNSPFLSLGATIPTGPLVGNGLWMGKDGSDYEFRVGTVSGGILTNGLHWDGSLLKIGATASEYISLDGSAITFYNGANSMASLSGTTWVLGPAAGDRLELTSTDLRFKTGASTTEAIFDANSITLGSATTMQTVITNSSFLTGDAAGENVYITSAGVYIRNSSTVYTSLVGSALTVGEVGASKSNAYLASGGLQLRTNTTVKVDLQSDGDVFIGTDTSAAATTTLAVFSAAQTYNGESLGVGDLLLGDNSSGKANIWWDKSAGLLYFRGGTTSGAYINTTGSIVAGAGAVTLDADGISIEAGTGTTNTLQWNSSGVLIGGINTYYGSGYNTTALYTKAYGLGTSSRTSLWAEDTIGQEFAGLEVWYNGTAGVTRLYAWNTGYSAVNDFYVGDNYFAFTATSQVRLGKLYGTGGADIVFESGAVFPNTGLHIFDTNASHDLIIAPGSDLTADRTLTLTTGDAARTITLSGNPTLADWFDQSVKTTGTPTFTQATVDNLRLDGNVLSSTSGAVTVTPLAGQNLDVSLSTTGNFVVNTNQFYVDTSTGWVGMGTTNPSGVLDLGSATTGRGIAWSGTAAGHYASIWTTYGAGDIVLATGMKGNTAADTYLSSASASQGRAAIRINAYTGTGGSLHFFTDADAAVTVGDTVTPTERMTIDYQGNVGINDTTPSYTLDITGTLRATSSAYLADIRPVSDSTTALQLKRSGGTAVVTVDTTNSRVGINGTPGAFAFDVTGTANVSAMLKGLDIWASASLGVGVQPTDPSWQVDVVGASRFTGAVTVTSDITASANILPTGYVARSRVTNQSITSLGSWSSSVTPGTNSAHQVTVVMYTTSGPTSIVEQAVWLVSSDNAGTKSVQLIGGVSTNHQVGHASGAIAVTNGVAATRYFNVSILRVL